MRACAVGMYMDISAEPSCVEIYQENAPHTGYHLDFTTGRTVAVRTPRFGHTVSGINMHKDPKDFVILNSDTLSKFILESRFLQRGHGNVRLTTWDIVTLLSFQRT